MALSPRLFALIGGIGGGCGLFPLILKETNNFSLSETQSSSTESSPSAQESDSSSSNTISSSPEQIPSTPTEITSPQQSPTSPSEKEVIKEETKLGNCISTEFSEELESMLWNLLIDRDSYTVISCENTNEDKESKLPSNWTGLFPETLFKRYTSTEKEKFEIKTKIQPLKAETNKYNISFSGNQFNTPVDGKWDGTTQDVGSYSNVISIKVTGLPEDKKIYLVAK